MTTYDDRLASKLGMPFLLNGSEKRIHVDVHDSSHIEP
jgi:hypothetical protein